MSLQLTTRFITLVLFPLSRSIPNETTRLLHVGIDIATREGRRGYQEADKDIFEEKSRFGHPGDMKPAWTREKVKIDREKWQSENKQL